MSQSWAEKNRARHVLRQIIKGEDALKAVVEISDQLRELGTMEEPSPARVGALKASADLKLRMLDKVLPDLKSVEHDMGETLGAMSEQELHDRIRHLIAAVEPGILAGIGVAAGGSAETLQ